MEKNVLVDSSFFISRFRRGLDPFQELAASDDDFEFYSCGVVKVEVCRGIVAPRLLKQHMTNFELACWVPTTDKIWDDALALAWNLARRGITMQVTDMVIAVCALSIDAAVLTLDSDFDNVPGLRVMRELR